MLARPDVFGAFEHHVLEKVSEPGPAGALVARSDVVGHGDREHRGHVVFRDDDTQAIFELGIGEGDARGGGGERGGDRQSGQRRRDEPCERRTHDRILLKMPERGPILIQFVSLRS